MFRKFILDLNDNIFDELSKSSKFEDICKGRKGAILVDCKDDLVPIVRTTTVYKEPAQRFALIHCDIIDKIRSIDKSMIRSDFNNAMIEIYDPNYRKMKFHTDQALDLQEDSYICLFSCYENASNSSSDLRKLKIQNKVTKEDFEVLLENRSIVLFSTSTNKKHIHKIVLESNTSTNRWLGITFRLSKTFIRFTNGIPYFYPSNRALRMATLDEKRELYKHKSDENANIDYVYPEIDYTISGSDLMLPIN